LFLLAPAISLIILNLTESQVTLVSFIFFVDLHDRLIAAVKEALLVKGH
jgi:hypothetical protein